MSLASDPPRKTKANKHTLTETLTQASEVEALGEPAKNGGRNAAQDSTSKGWKSREEVVAPTPFLSAACTQATNESGGDGGSREDLERSPMACPSELAG